MKKLFIANWKSSMSAGDVTRFLKEFKNPKPKLAEVALASSFLHLSQLKKVDIKVAQDVSVHPVGAFTGDIAADQLSEAGVSMCLVGHSERRIYHAETEDDIFAKIERLLAARIYPVLCVGENAEEREQNKTAAVLRRQLSVLKDVSMPELVIIAYEPVWAISTFQTGKKKNTATNEQIVEAHQLIRKILISMIGEDGECAEILYGGSVTPENSAAIINLDDVDGVLVGGASTDAKKFMKIINNLK